MVLPVGGDAHEFAPLSSGHPGQDEDLVTFGDHVVNLQPGLIERGVEHLEQLPHPGFTRREARHLLVFDEGVRDEFVDRTEVCRPEVCRPDSPEELTCQGLVRIGAGVRHRHRDVLR